MLSDSPEHASPSLSGIQGGLHSHVKNGFLSTQTLLTPHGDRSHSFRSETGDVLYGGPQAQTGTRPPRPKSSVLWVESPTL